MRADDSGPRTFGSHSQVGAYVLLNPSTSHLTCIIDLGCSGDAHVACGRAILHHHLRRELLPHPTATLGRPLFHGFFFLFSFSRVSSEKRHQPAHPSCFSPVPIPVLHPKSCATRLCPTQTQLVLTPGLRSCSLSLTGSTHQDDQACPSCGIDCIAPCLLRACAEATQQQGGPTVCFPPDNSLLVLLL
jgi:hypothetical protein